MPHFIPYACLDCRRSFKQPHRFANEEQRKCPNCGAMAYALHHNFRAPRSNNLKQWKKVGYLIEHGFRFVPVWNPENEAVVPYPELLREAPEWVERWKHLAWVHGGPLQWKEGMPRFIPFRH